MLALCEYLGIDPPFIGSTIVGGSSFEHHVAHAMSAIEQGLCSVAVIAYGSTQRSIGRKQASVREINPYEMHSHPFSAVERLRHGGRAPHAPVRHHAREQLAAVAVARELGADPIPSPGRSCSRFRRCCPHALASYLFTVRDICLVTDGGGAVIVTSAERAKSLKKKPAYVLGQPHHALGHLQHARPDRHRRVGLGQGRL